MFRQPLPRVAMVATATLAAACGSPQASALRDAMHPATGALATATVPVAGPPESRVLPPHALQAFSYAGIHYEPQQGVIEAARPEGARARLVLRAKAPARFEVPLDAELRLSFANGARVTAPLPSLGASQEAAVEVAGEVPAATTWEGATLTVAEAGREPLEIRLGQQEEAPATFDLGEAVRAPNHYGEQVTYEVTSAELALDGPRRGGFYGRAPEGQRFLRVRVAATNEDGRHGVSIGEEAFAMTTDAGPASIALGVTAQTVALRQRAEFEVVLLVPAASRQFLLQVGADGKAPGRIAIARTDADASLPTASTP